MLAISVFLLFAGAGVLLLLLGRRTFVRRTARLDGTESHPSVRRSDFVHTFELLTRTSFTGRDRIEPYRTGDEMWWRILDDIESAGHVITWQVPTRSGRLCDRVHDVLAARARAGVSVLLLRDGIGVTAFEAGDLNALMSAGVRVARSRTLHLPRRQDGRNGGSIRSIVIDGRIGWSGGFSVDDRWLREPFTAESWRDTSLRLEGPVVEQLQASFLARWGEATGDLLIAEGLLRASESTSAQRDAAVLPSGADGGDAHRFWVLTVAGVHERLWITDAGFAPDATLLRLLGNAVSRGVDVRVLTSAQHNGRRSSWYAARAHDAAMLQLGVRIFEYRFGHLAARTVVADGIWSCVGRIDPRPRSIGAGESMGIVARDPELAARLEQLFIEDLSRSREITLDTIHARPLHARVAERAASVVAPLL